MTTRTVINEFYDLRSYPELINVTDTTDFLKGRRDVINKITHYQGKRIRSIDIIDLELNKCNDSAGYKLSGTIDLEFSNYEKETNR